MTRLLRSLLAKADTWSPRALLWVNVALAGLVSVAHGGALLVSRAQSLPEAADIERLASVSLPLAGLVLVCGVLGLVLPYLRMPAIGLHGAVFFCAAIGQFVWGINLLIHGIPPGNFSWSVGLFTAAATYAVYLFSRFTVPLKSRATPVVYYSPVFALVAAALMDTGIFIRLVSQSSSLVNG